MFLMQTGVDLMRGTEQAAQMGISRDTTGVSWRVSVRLAGNAVDLTGMSVYCHVLRGDGTGVERVAGTAGVGYAEARIPDAAFAVPGECRLTMRAENEAAGEKTTLAVMNIVVV